MKSLSQSELPQPAERLAGDLKTALLVPGSSSVDHMKRVNMCEQNPSQWPVWFLPTHLAVFGSDPRQLTSFLLPGLAGCLQKRPGSSFSGLCWNEFNNYVTMGYGLFFGGAYG